MNTKSRALKGSGKNLRSMQRCVLGRLFPRIHTIYADLDDMIDESKLASILASANWLPTATSPNVSVASLGFSTRAKHYQ